MGLLPTHPRANKVKDIQAQRERGLNNRTKRDASRFVRDYMSDIKGILEYFAVKWYDIVPDCFHGSAPVFDEHNSEIWWHTKKLDEEIVDLTYHISHKRTTEIISGSSLYGDVEYMAHPVTTKHCANFLWNIRKVLKTKLLYLRLWAVTSCGRLLTVS
jgi:hypothetical protein